MGRCLRTMMTSALAITAGCAMSFTVAAPIAQAQTQGVIRRILVEGNQRIEAATVLSYLTVRPGDAFDERQLDLSLKTLAATNLFDDVQFENRNGDLVIIVVENPIINLVVFEGNKTVSREDLEEEVQAESRGVFTRARVQADVQRILQVYRRAGRFAAQVTPQFRTLDQNRVDLIFEIDEGPSTGIRGINFIGNKKFSDSDLRGVLVTQQSRWWKFFSSNDNYDPDRLEFDRQQLREFYLERGYADFRVLSAVAELTPDQKDFYVTFTIDEGERFNWGSVSVETQLQKLNPIGLKALLPIKEGDRFNGSQIETAIESLTFAAGIAGYSSVDIQPQVNNNSETREVDITFNVNEGPRVYVERIEIIGNSRTIDRVIRREIAIAEGDAFNRILLDRSRNNLRRLQFFEEVEITDRPGSQPDRAVVEVEIKEQPTGEFAVAAGFSSVDQLFVQVSIAERNLGGRGQGLQLQVSNSRRQRNISVSFTEPRFLDRNLGVSFQAFTARTDFLFETGQLTTATGFTIGAGFPLTARSSLRLRYRLQNNNSVFVTGNPIFDAIISPAINQGGLESSVGYTYSFDRTNDPISPTRGYRFSLNQDVAGLGGDVRFLRSQLSASFFRGLFRGVTARFDLTAGYITPFGGDTVRNFDRFIRGGNQFRGFDITGLGPRVLLVQADPLTGEVVSRVDALSASAVGGNAFYIGSFEVSLPLFLPDSFGLSAGAFFEFGSVGIVEQEEEDLAILRAALSNGFINPFTGDFNLPAVQLTSGANGGLITAIGPNGLPIPVNSQLIVDDGLSLRSSFGISIYWNSPFGPVQFDFAEVLGREDFDQTEGFRFTTRTRF